MTKSERIELAEKLNSIQATIDSLLDVIVGKEEPAKDSAEARHDLLVSISADCAKAKKAKPKTKKGK